MREEFFDSDLNFRTSIARHVLENKIDKMRLGWPDLLSLSDIKLAGPMSNISTGIEIGEKFDDIDEQLDAENDEKKEKSLPQSRSVNARSSPSPTSSLHQHKCHTHHKENSQDSSTSAPIHPSSPIASPQVPPSQTNS